MVNLLQRFIDFNNAIWRYKKSRGIALSQSLSVRCVYAPVELEPLKDDLKAMHRIDDLRFGSPENMEEAIELSEGIFIVE